MTTARAAQSIARPSDAGPGGQGLAAGDVRLWLVVLATLAALLWSWSRQEGYQLADSVEYLERAQGIAYGRALIDSQAIRGFGFSGLLVPLYWIYGAFSLDEPVRIMQAAQLLQVLLSLALVWTTARFAARLCGAAGGLAAGILLGTNPVLLRWGVEPVSGIAAALFVTLAISSAMRAERDVFAPRATEPPAPGDAPGSTPGTKRETKAESASSADRRGARRDSWIAGAWLGLAFLMAYQTILVIGAVMFVLLLRHGRRGFTRFLATLAAFLAVVLVQCALDRWYYGTFGISVGRYLVENFGSNFARLVHRCGSLPVIGPACYDAAEWIYNHAFPPNENTLAYQDQVVAGAEAIKTQKPYLWYFQNLARCLVWPAAALVALGFLRAAFQRARVAALLWLVVLVSALAMSVKGSKDFRLWLPILPLLAALGGIGFTLLAPRTGALRLLTWLLVLASIPLGAREFTRTNTQKYGGFWRAIAAVNERAAREHERRPAGTKLRLSAAYHWSMFLRESSQVELVKLPHHLDGWKSYDDEKRAKDFETLASLDAFITHLPVLTENPDLFEVINRDFAVTGAFYDRVVYDSLGPIYVLERRASDAGGLRFFRRETGVSAAEAIRRAGGGPRLVFARGAPDSHGAREHLELVDARYTPLDGDGHGWITYTWRGGPLSGAEWRFFDRLTAPDFQNSWQNNHRPAYGMAPTSTWSADTWLEESYLFVAEAEPFLPGREYRRLGGAWRRGDLLPLTLWLDVVRFDDARAERVDRLPALDPVSLLPVAEIAPTPDRTTRSGATTARDGMTRAGSLFAPVGPTARVADDGRPIALSEAR